MDFSKEFKKSIPLLIIGYITSVIVITFCFKQESGWFISLSRGVGFSTIVFLVIALSGLSGSIDIAKKDTPKEYEKYKNENKNFQKLNKKRRIALGFFLFVVIALPLIYAIIKGPGYVYYTLVNVLGNYAGEQESLQILMKGGTNYMIFGIPIMYVVYVLFILLVTWFVYSIFIRLKKDKI